MIRIFLKNDLGITFVLVKTDQNYFKQSQNQWQKKYVEVSLKFLFQNQKSILFELWIALIPQTYRCPSDKRLNYEVLNLSL